VTGSYLERLASRTAATGTVLCLGLDPDPDALPDGFRRDLAGVERFATLLLEAALPACAAVKPNLAFFEAFGSAGLAALERLRATIPTDVPVIADAKRGDIGSTAEHYAREAFERYCAHAVTLSPYMGLDSIEPFLAYPDRGAFVLCRTSNAGGNDLQMLAVAGERVFERIARLAATQWNANGQLGLVVGATFPAELARVRELIGDLPVLVPGIGAQGGDIAAVVTAGRTASGSGLVINSSRAILYAGDGDDFVERARAAALATRDDINRHRRARAVG
jgi:orotidine-5'-phosphate decarboxylase